MMSTIQKNIIDIVEDKKTGVSACLLKAVLRGASFLYRPTSSLMRVSELRRKKKLPCVVISVGNITWGGTGKTPLIALLIKEILKKGKKVAVLMRGYGRDEHLLLQTKFPMVDVVCGKNRYKNGLTYLADKHADVFLLDDGFQQWGLHRDLDIITINCLNPWGNGFLLPRGSLREPLASLKRAGIVVLTNAHFVSDEHKKSIKQKIAPYVPVENIVESIHQPYCFFRADTPREHVALETLRGEKVLIFSGIGSSASFKKTVEKIGMSIVEHIVFEDHHQYTYNDCEHIKKKCALDPSVSIITTEKDLMRNHVLLTKEINPYILKVHMELQDNYDTFIHRLDRILGR